MTALRIKLPIAASAILTLFAPLFAVANPLGNAFTYQGRLTDSGGPATGLYDFQFVLCDAATNGAALVTNTVAVVPVTNGLYNVALDFGANAFDGNARWLELFVRTNGGTTWTELLPRLALTPTPYALHAAAASVVTGPIPDSQLPANIARLNGTNVFTGPVTAPSFSGSGSGLSGVAPASGSSNYVSKAGDTMTGELALPSIGLRVGPGRALMQNYYGLNGLSINPYEDWPYTALGGKVGIGNFADALVPTASLDIMGDNAELKIRPTPSQPGGATLTLLGAGSSSNKVKIIMHSVTLESASGGGGEYLKISNGAKDVAYFGSDGNVGIGTTSPASLLNIQVANSVNVNDGLNVSRASGADVFGVHLKSDGAGNYRSALTVKGNGGSEIEAVSFANLTGWVGIGTTSPADVLQVVGTISARGEGTNGYIGLNRGGTDYAGYIDFFKNGPTRIAYLGYKNGGSSNLSLNLENSANFVVNGGNVGIGTTSPNLGGDRSALTVSAGTSGDYIARLEVQGTRSADNIYGALDFYHKANNTASIDSYRSGADDAGNLTFWTKTTGVPLAERMRIDNSGNVGIGTTSPQAALHVSGNAIVTGTNTVKVLSITGGADVAEPFPVASQQIPKGSVVVIDDEHPGQLKQSTEPYDQRVAGIVSGANGINPGITLSQQGALEGGQNVALSGRVYVLADAANAPINPGDLLTTSPVPGHAMKVTDHAKAQGAILGKAMSRLPEGRGLVLVLVTLQ